MPSLEENECRQKGTAPVKPNRRLLRAWPALVVGLAVLFAALLIVSFSRSPLSAPPSSPLESRLVGQWYDDDPGDTHTFFPDRTFATSNGQFVGVWRIKDGRLMLTYWQRYELPYEYNYAAIANSIRRTRKETCLWHIKVTEDGKQIILSVPVSKDAPDGQWLWRRVADE